MPVNNVSRGFQSRSRANLFCQGDNSLDFGATYGLCCSYSTRCCDKGSHRVRKGMFVAAFQVKLYLQKQAASYGVCSLFGRKKVRERSGAFNTRLRSFLFYFLPVTEDFRALTFLLPWRSHSSYDNMSHFVIRFHPSYQKIYQEAKLFLRQGLENNAVSFALQILRLCIQESQVY